MQLEVHRSTPVMHRSPEHPIIGKTITGVIARPGSDGREIVMLQFDDGTCFEVLSPRSRDRLARLARDRRAARRAPVPATPSAGLEPGQLSFFPQDGDLQAA